MSGRSAMRRAKGCRSNGADDALSVDYEQRAKRILSRPRIRDFGQKWRPPRAASQRVALCATTLISESDLLILDEPTNHLDTDMTEARRVPHGKRCRAVDGDPRPVFPRQRVQ